MSDVLDKLDKLDQLVEELRVALTGDLEPEPLPLGVTSYSQNDPRWAREIYAGNYTFARAGCYVTCVAMITSLAGYLETPGVVAMRMREAECFSGPNLCHAERIPDAYRLLEWPSGAYYNRPGALMQPPRMDKIRRHIDEYGALILKVDYKPENYKYNMHFVLAVSYGLDDFEIIDPLDGQRHSLLNKYGKSRGWDVAQAIYGYRALRVA